MQVNKLVCAATGYSHEELLRGKMDLLLPKKLFDNHEKKLQNYLKKAYVKPRAFNDKIYVKTKDNFIAPVYVYVSAILN